ncbi:hypothetical protein SFRURICE_018949, partial [Spodoptera frugiperda]
GSILYIENIERINSRGCYWIDTKPKYFYSTERELNSSSSIEGSPYLLCMGLASYSKLRNKTSTRRPTSARTEFAGGKLVNNKCTH